MATGIDVSSGMTLYWLIINELTLTSTLTYA
jgi:hypothetical protein